MERDNADDSIFPPLFDLRAVWDTLWRRRLLVAAVTAAVIALAGLYILVTTPTYTATASVLVDTRDSRAVNFNNVLPGIGADSAAIASQVNVIRSQELLNTVFDEQHIAKDPEFAGHGLISGLLSAIRAPRPLTRDVIFRRFQSKVGVSREGLTYVIDVSFTSHDPVKAARIANAIVDSYKASLEGEKESANSEVSSVLTNKIATLQKSVGEAERAVQDFKFKHNIFDATAGGTLQQQIDQLSTQLVTAQDKADQAEDKYKQALAAGTSPQGLARLSEILSSPTTDKLRNDYNQRAAALANLETVYGPKHPAVVRLQSELVKVRRLMAAEAERITRELKANRDLAAQNVKTLQDKLASLRSQSNQSDLAQVQLRQLQGKADAARAVLNDFLKRAQETSQLGGLQLSQVRVISKAVPPVQPTWPKPFLLLPVSAILGFLGGCGLALTFGAAAAGAPLGAAAEGAGETPIRSPQLAAPARLQMPHAPLLPVRSAIADLGTYMVPIAPGGMTRSGVRQLREHLFRSDGAAFSRDVVRLLKEIIGRLEQHDRPFLILFSSPQPAPAASYACAMVGLGLEAANESAVVVEFAAAPRGPAPLLSVAVRRGPEEFRDPASGLRTMVLDKPSATAGGAEMVRDIVAQADATSDFVLVDVGPFSDTAWWRPLSAAADLVLFALGPGDAPDAAATLAKNLPAETLEHSATLVVSPVGDKSERADGPTGADIEGWHQAAAAGG